MSLRAGQTAATRISQARPADVAVLVLLGAVWGSTFTWVEFALVDYGPVTIAAARLAFGGAALAALGAVLGFDWPRGGRTWLLLFVTGFFNSSLPFFLQSFGQRTLEAGHAAVLIGTAPVFALVLNHWLTADDRINWRKAAGIALGFSGIVLLVGADALAGATQSVWAQFALVAVAACYALSSTLVRFITGLSNLSASAWLLLTSTLYMVPAAAWLERPWEATFRLSSFGALLIMGLVTTAAAFYLRVWLIRRAGAVFMSQVSYLVPVFGLFWGWLLLDEVPAWTLFLALGLVLAGVLLSRKTTANAAAGKAAGRGK
jgi:drug/metabolite transporter (DMT)-like permease